MNGPGYLQELRKYEEVDEEALLASLSSEELRELECQLAELEADDDVPVGLRQQNRTRTDGCGRQEKQQEKTQEKEGGRQADNGNTSDDGKKPWWERAAEDEEEERRKRAKTWRNSTVVEEALEKVCADDPATREVNLNNMEDISAHTLLRFARALHANTHVHVFTLANTRADDRMAFAVSDMLRRNRSIRSLNIESNFLSGRGVLALFEALQSNRSLLELRFHNQRHICGGRVEMEMVQLLRVNTTLLKLGYHFELPGPRMAATAILTRNQDQQRQRRLQQQWREQKTQENAQKTPENQKRNMPAEKKLTDKAQWRLRKPKNGSEKESVDVMKELKKSQHRRQEEASRPPQPGCRDDLMAAIRGSSIRSLKRVDVSQI